MYTYFFTYQDALPENCGFPLFGGIHFIWLTCIAIGIFLLCRTYLRLTKTRQLQILNTTVLLALCCTFMQDAILTVTGHMNARTLPFHLCDLQDFFICFCKCRHYAPDAGVSFQKSHCAFLCLVLSLAFYFRCGVYTRLFTTW